MAILLAGTFLVLMIFSRLEHRMIYFPMKEIEADPSRVALPFEEVSIQTTDGVRLHGWWVPQDGAAITVLVLHGNAGNISHRLERIALLARLGVNTLIVDYRGYGRSEGRPSENGLYRDADAAYRHLRVDRGHRADRIVLFGKSLGGAVAADLASRVEVGGLILESTFTSMKEMARRTIPILPAHLLVRSRFDTLEKVPEIKCPTLVIHGQRDELVPIELGREVFDAAGGQKDFFAVPGAGHNDVLMVGGETYRDRLRSFLDRVAR